MILVVFTFSALTQSLSAYAATKTGTIKVFSEIKGIELFIDEKPMGQDTAEIKDIEIGSHYVKATKDGVDVFSELITVQADTTTTILIKDNGQFKQKLVASKYKESQEYKNKKLDIILSQNTQTVGTATTTYNNFPGYFSFLDYSTTNAQSTSYTTTDWKIIQGGVQEISDMQFAQLVNDKDTIARMNKAIEDSSDSANIGAIVALTGLVLAIAGGAAAIEAKPEVDITGAVIVCTIGVVGTFVGLAMLSKEPYLGHYVTPAQAAKQAHEYNQGLKKQLGLPEDFEIQ
jgi:hypothetical protein